MIALPAIPKSAEGLALAQLLATHQNILHIATSDREMAMLAEQLRFFVADAEIIVFPAWDCLPYDRASPLSSIMAARISALSALLKPAQKPRMVLTTANAILQKLPPKEVIQHIGITLTRGDKTRIDAITTALLAQGYQRVGKAMEPGEFALRGGIIDIVAPGQAQGARIDLFGDEIEAIKPFDPLSQITQGSVNSINLYPASEVLLNEETAERFRTQYRDLFGAVTKEDPLYESITHRRAWPGMEHWLPLFYERTDTLPDYFGGIITFDAETKTAMEERRESIIDYFEARKSALAGGKKNSFAAGGVYNPLPPEHAFIMEAEWDPLLARCNHAEFSPFNEAQTSRYRPVIRLAQGTNPFEQLKERSAAANKATLIACFSTGSRERLQTLLMEHEFHTLRIEQWSDVKNISGKTIGLAVLPLENGFETDTTLILSEQDIFGERITRAPTKKKKSDVFLMEAANFAEGELVVHKEHGIGRFEGLVTLTVSGAAHDCLKLIYEGDDKLFLPVENIEMVTRFGLEEEHAKLDKLGGAAWQSRKAKLKQRILLAAAELLKTAAERLVKTAPTAEAASGTYDEFCARFAYVETEDQARAIGDVIQDLQSGKPMDRLICGDVGFGKTEVALRAAFVVANCHPERSEGSPSNLGDPSVAVLPQDDKKEIQVAVIAPTTLLARQHYYNFAERFAGFPVVVRQLSRMVPAREQEKTREALAKGEVDIIVGTHALLSKNVQFKNLGLLIVDEEQHFGVAQKEKLKSLKSDIHVLTLSATPIPRTLQMALTGVRDLSLITTPPVDRLAVRSFVMPFDPVVIKEAIERELHRGGKCFIVTPRIKHIGEVKAQLLELVPNLRLAVAHGQMPAAELDEIMNDFYDGKYDALLSTAIIESGLDVPTANTIIIHNAHLLGLSQLYQLRGRVGRGKLRAYAYFLLPHYKELSKNATRRLEVMQTLDTLGAGFTLASHDMDIRGFGNLVGEEQSGHIREVGIELYQQMLEEAVAELKATSSQRLAASENSTNRQPLAAANSLDYSPQINLGLSVLIPETYVDDLQLRLGLYRRAAGLASEEDINSFAAEMVDRFGPLPQEVSHFIATLGIKTLCKKAGIERMDVGPKGAVLTFRNNIFAKPEALIAYVAKNARTLKIRPDQKLVFTHEWKSDEDKINTVKKLATAITELTQ